MRKGFTLIELLITIAIIGILVSISLFGLQGARESGRDSKRKADLELIRSGLETYRADCNKYPAALSFGSALNGDGSVPSCAATNVYLTSVPQDPTPGSRGYYYSLTGTTYQLCASLETGGSGSCSGACGTSTCNYKVVNP